MTKKPRKSLDDSLANEFVYGSDKPQTGAAPTPDVELETEEATPTPPIEEQPVTEKPKKESSLMQKLQVEAKEGTKRFTIDLRESVHRKLSILAAKTGRSKADIVRMLLDDALENINE
ncbi:CopG family transcriptional regulator [Myxosarcina sp. GI1(2024)]